MKALLDLIEAYRLCFIKRPCGQIQVELLGRHDPSIMVWVVTLLREVDAHRIRWPLEGRVQSLFVHPVFCPHPRQGAECGNRRSAVPLLEDEIVRGDAIGPHHLGMLECCLCVSQIDLHELPAMKQSHDAPAKTLCPCRRVNRCPRESPHEFPRRDAEPVNMARVAFLSQIVPDFEKIAFE